MKNINKKDSSKDIRKEQARSDIQRLKAKKAILQENPDKFIQDRLDDIDYRLKRRTFENKEPGSIFDILTKRKEELETNPKGIVRNTITATNKAIEKEVRELRSLEKE